jgi:chemotaxis protein methyltransferase CheR
MAQVPGGVVEMTEREFGLFQSLIYREAGIHLAPVKKALLVGRLSRRLRELGLNSFTQYFALVDEGGDPAERVLMFDRVTTNETRFFREPAQFDWLQREALPRWRAEAERGLRARRVRAWSAGCSTGEEPYSVAMMLRHRLPASEGWQVEVLATDLSTRVLDAARAAVWPLHRAGEIPAPFLESCMLRGVREQKGRMRVAPETRALVQFARLNLERDPLPEPRSFDLVFCRNVLIYFSAESRGRAVNRLLDRVAPGGYLLLGHAESLHGISDRARAVAPSVYAVAA